MQELLLFLAQHSNQVWGASGATIAFLANRVWSSPKEKKIDNREDFKTITNSLFKEVAALRNDVETYKEDAAACDQKYNELQTKFIDFKSKYNELELRYQIQVNINKKISEEIKNLEAQITQLEKDKTSSNDNQNSTTGETTTTPGN